MRRRFHFLCAATILAPLLFGALASPLPAFADPPRAAPVDVDRGRALYNAACDACHSQNIHWRAQHIVDSWESLLAQVKRWQANAGQRWEATDIRNVAAYLNQRFYQFPCPATQAECADKQAAR